MSTETREPRGEIDDVPVPEIARDEILVKIKSTAVNHLDLVKASGTLRQILPIGLPWIPGHEYSGIVEEIGGDVAGYAPGHGCHSTRIAGRGRQAPYVRHNEDARAVAGHARKNRTTAGRRYDTTRRVATMYALQDAAQAWKDVAGKLPGVHRMSPSGPGAQEAGHTARPCFVWPRHLQAFEQAFSGRIRGGAVQAKTMIDGLLWWTSALKMEYES